MPSRSRWRHLRWTNTRTRSEKTGLVSVRDVETVDPKTMPDQLLTHYLNSSAHLPALRLLTVALPNKSPMIPVVKERIVYVLAKVAEGKRDAGATAMDVHDVSSRDLIAAARARLAAAANELDQLEGSTQ